MDNEATLRVEKSKTKSVPLPLVFNECQETNIDVDPILQKMLLRQPCQFSCCERNWSTYSFIHSI